MLHMAAHLTPSSAFWRDAAREILSAVDDGRLGTPQRSTGLRQLARLQVIVPSAFHVPLLKAALAAEIGASFAAPRIGTFLGWLAMCPPDQCAITPAASECERLMALYAALRNHPWLKKMFAMRRNTDLLPLAQTLLALCDELTCAMLPTLEAFPDQAKERWEAALEQLPPPVRQLLSEESQLVWAIWKSQLDDGDPIVGRFARMKFVASQADRPLVWIAATEANPLEQAFTEIYTQHQPVLRINMDWRCTALDLLYATAWPELCDGEPPADEASMQSPAKIALCRTSGLEDEAICAAQTVLDWLAAGKTCVAIIAQDRVAARRTRALLERAGVLVTDETGWKLSTTRAAAAIASWFDVVVSRAETAALLNLLKSPFVLPRLAGKTNQLMQIEMALRRANATSGWHAAIGAVAALPEARLLVLTLAQEAAGFAERKTADGWVAATRAILDLLDMQPAMEADDAGRQVLAVLEAAARIRPDGDTIFSLMEWRALICMQLEATTFVPTGVDRRVTMLPLAESRLRRFDAALVLGADAAHLPSQQNDHLFFADAVRRELGLSTREQRQRQQMRDLMSLVCCAGDVVFSWQSARNGEPNPVSPWIDRLELALEHAGLPPLARKRPVIAATTLSYRPQTRPAPSAPHLLPQRLTASAFGKLISCPYHFFAAQMLRLSALDELSDQPEKRDYGDWLHEILNRYHMAVRDNDIALHARPALLRDVTEQVFGPALQRHGSALGYYARWQKVMPLYLDWANEREEKGWHFVAGECRFEKQLEWSGGSITLHGRIDRIDAHLDGRRAVLDYKTSNVQSLSKRLKNREDHQLGFYGVLADMPFDAAHYVALEPLRDKTGDAQPDDYMKAQELLAEQIVSCMQSIATGAPLQANGIEAICQYCDMRGLCRKGAWQ